MNNTYPPPWNNQPSHGPPWAPPPLPPQQQWASSPLPPQRQWAPPAGSWPPPGYPHVRPRNPALYAIASAVIPGLGTLLGGAPGRGIVIFLVLAITGVLRFVPLLGLLFIPLWFVGWAFGIYDAHRTTRDWNARHGIIS